MSRGIITAADPNNNSYAVNIAGYGESLPAQCITRDEMEVGSEVEVVDWDNISPDKMLQFGNLRLAPNVGEYVYTPSKKWTSYEELIQLEKKATLSRAFFYSSEWYNPRWQTECPLYRGGKVVSIIDNKEMFVRIWSRPISADSAQITLKCTTDYMACDTVAFKEDDLVVIQFKNSCIECPVVIGFWINPQPCGFQLRLFRDFDDEKVNEANGYLVHFIIYSGVNIVFEADSDHASIQVDDNIYDFDVSVWTDSGQSLDGYRIRFTIEDPESHRVYDGVTEVPLIYQIWKFFTGDIFYVGREEVYDITVPYYWVGDQEWVGIPHDLPPESWYGALCGGYSAETYLKSLILATGDTVTFAGLIKSTYPYEMHYMIYPGALDASIWTHQDEEGSPTPCSADTQCVTSIRQGELFARNNIDDYEKVIVNGLGMIYQSSWFAMEATPAVGLRTEMYLREQYDWPIEGTCLDEVPGGDPFPYDIESNATHVEVNFPGDPLALYKIRIEVSSISSSSSSSSMSSSSRSSSSSSSSRSSSSSSSRSSSSRSSSSSSQA